MAASTPVRSLLALTRASCSSKGVGCAMKPRPFSSLASTHCRPAGRLIGPSVGCSSGRHTLAVSFSSQDSSSSFFSPITWWRNRQETKEAEKYKQRIIDMSNQATWTLSDMQAELQEAVDSWMAKVPGLSDNKEMNMAKQMHKTLSGIIAVVGAEATGQELTAMTRAQKLKAAVAGETTVEEVTMLVQQFEIMALMHRVVRRRKAEGKPIPTTAEGMQALMQTDATKMMSKAHKSRMMEAQAKTMRRSSRRRR